MTVTNPQTDRQNDRPKRTSTGGTDGRADRLIHLAGQVARLSPDRRDPEQFHIQKSEIVATLRRLARESAA